MVHHASPQRLARAAVPAGVAQHVVLGPHRRCLSTLIGPLFHRKISPSPFVHSLPRMVADWSGLLLMPNRNEGGATTQETLSTRRFVCAWESRTPATDLLHTLSERGRSLDPADTVGCSWAVSTSKRTTACLLASFSFFTLKISKQNIFHVRLPVKGSWRWPRKARGDRPSPASSGTSS